MYDVRGRWLGDVVRLRGHESVGKGGVVEAEHERCSERRKS